MTCWSTRRKERASFTSSSKWQAPHSDSSFLARSAFIVAKITLVVLFLSCAAIKYHRRYKMCNYITVMLSVYCVMVSSDMHECLTFCFLSQLLCLLVMDFSIKIIPVFFALVLLANYFNFISFWLMLRHLPRVKGRSLRKRTKCYFATMNLLYVAVVVMSFFPPFQPKCTQEKAYPYVMSWASFLFIVNYFFHWVVNCRKEFWLKPIDDQAEACEAANGAINSELAKAMTPLMSSKDGDEKTTSGETYEFNWSLPH